MKSKSVFELIKRLNEIMAEQQKLELKSLKFSEEIKTERDRLDDEYNSLVLELWDRIPSLKADENIQPKKRIKGKV